MDNSSDKDIALSEFMKSGLRTFVRESYDLVVTYCESVEKTDHFKKWHFYHFFRIIRNTPSHNFKIELNNRYIKQCPIIWRSKKIEASMNSQFLDLSFFGFNEGLQFHEDLSHYIFC